VVQLYVRNLVSERIQPMKKLRAFKRISLKPGESNTVQFDLSGEDFRFWNEETDAWAIESGEFEIQMGNSSQNILLKEKV
jgi:beta-glucosidase